MPSSTTPFDSIFSNDESTTTTPSLTNCLRLVLDEEVLQLLPHRIVAIRSAKRKKRNLMNQATAANVGIAVDDVHFAHELEFLEQQHKHQLNKRHNNNETDDQNENENASPKTHQHKRATNDTLIFISEEEADKTREEAQQEMRSLVLDRAEFVSALTELLVERELLRETVLRESLARYSGDRLNISNFTGGGSLEKNNNNSNSRGSSPHRTNRSGSPRAATAGGCDQFIFSSLQQSSASSKKPDRNNNNSQHTTEIGSASSNQTGYFTETEAKFLISRVWIYDKFKLLLMQQAKEGFTKFAQQQETSSSSSNNNTTNSRPSSSSTSRRNTKQQPLGKQKTSSSSNHQENDNTSNSGNNSRPTSARSQQQQQNPRRHKRITSVTKKSEQRTFMNFWRICPYQSRMMTRIVFNLPRYQLHPDDAAALDELQANPSIANEKLQRLSKYNQNSKVEVIVDDDHNSDIDEEEEDEKEKEKEKEVTQDQHQHENNTSTPKKEISLSSPISPSPATPRVKSRKDPTKSLYGDHSPNRRIANDKIAFLLSGLANVDIWMRKHDHDSPFPAEFIEALPRVRELRAKIEPLVDFVFSAADTDHTNQVTFRYITELILEREGRLSAVPFRANLNFGMELVADNGADGIRDLLIPKGTNHISSIEGSPHLMLLSNSEGSELINGTTGNYVIKMKQPNLKKPRVLEMSLKEICYALLSERAREAQMEQDKLMFRQNHEMKLRRARTSAEQMTVSTVGAGASVFLGGAHNREGQQRAARAMHATSLAHSSANAKNDSFTTKTFRDSRYIVCTDGSMGLYFYYFDEGQIPSIFSKDPDVYLKLPVVPTSYACAGGYVFVGDSLGHVRVLDATSILLHQSFETCLAGHYQGNHHFVQTFRSKVNEQLQQDANTFYAGEEFLGQVPTAIKAAFTVQNYRPENHQLGHACVTSIETLFHQGHNKFAFTLLDGTLNVIDVPTMSLVWCQEAHAGGATMIKRIWGTDTYLTLGFDHTPKIWQGLGGLATQSIRLVDTKQPHTTRISAVELGVEQLREKTVRGCTVMATRLFTADLSGLIKTWDLASNLCTHSLYTVDLKNSSRLRKPKEHFSAATVRAIANYQDAAPIQQGCYISSAGRFLYLGYRVRGLVKLCPAENTVRAHFGPAVSLPCPISGRMITAAGNAIRTWTLFPGESDASSSSSAFHAVDPSSSSSNKNNKNKNTNNNNNNHLLVNFSPLLVDVVSPYILGYAVSMCVNLEEERVFVATSSGCIVVMRIETGRVLKVFFPHGKGALAAEATVLTANDKAGELIASEDVAAFSQQDPSGEILGICYSYGSRELVVHYAQENTLNIFSDVGKQRLPVRTVSLRTSMSELGTQSAMTALNNRSLAVFSQISSGGAASSEQQLEKNAVASFLSNNNKKKLLEFRGLAALWSNFCHTGSPSIVTQMPDLNLGIYSLDSETGLEHQRLTANVEIPCDNKDKIRYDRFGYERMEDGTVKKIIEGDPALIKAEIEKREKAQQRALRHRRNRSGSIVATGGGNDEQDEGRRDSTTSASSEHHHQLKKEDETTATNYNNKDLQTTVGTGLFKDMNAKREVLYKSKNFLPTACCSCFLGDYSFVAIGCTLDNAILFYPSRSGIQGRSENGLESRVTEFTPMEPFPCGVIHHIAEPHLMTFAPVRKLLYVADQKCRVVVYSMSKWLDTFNAKTTLELIEGSVYAPRQPQLVVPSSFHEIPKWAVWVDKKNQEKELKKAHEDNINVVGSNKKKSASSTTFLTSVGGDGISSSSLSLTTFGSSSIPLNRDGSEDISRFHKLALRAISFTERLLKDRHAPPLAPFESSSSSENNNFNNNTGTFNSTTYTFGTSHQQNKNQNNNNVSCDELYQQWLDAQPTIVSVIPDAFHFSEGAIEPRGETEPPWKKYQTITTISVVDRHLLMGTAIAISYGSGIVLLFNEYLDRCVGELRADSSVRFSFTPFLPMVLEHQQKQIESIQKQNKRQMEIGKLGKSKLFASSLMKKMMIEEKKSKIQEQNRESTSRDDKAADNDDENEDDDDDDDDFNNKMVMSLDQSLLSTLNNNSSSVHNLNSPLAIALKKRLKLPVFEEVEYHNSILRMFVLSYLQSAISLGGSTVPPERDETIKVISALLGLPRYASPDEIDAVLTALSAQQQTERQQLARLEQQQLQSGGAAFSEQFSGSFLGSENFSFGAAAGAGGSVGDFLSATSMHQQPSNSSFSRHAKEFLMNSSSKNKNDDDPTSAIKSLISPGGGNNTFTNTGVTFKGISLWLSMAQKLGGNEEKRWYRFVQWRRLEEWHRQIEACRKELPASQVARKKVLQEEEQTEMQKQSLMTVTERRMYLKEKATQERKRQQILEADALRRGGRMLEVPLEYLSHGEMIDKGRVRALRLIGPDLVRKSSSIGAFMVETANLDEELLKEKQELERRTSFSPGSAVQLRRQESLVPTVPKDVLEMSNARKRRSVVQISTNDDDDDNDALVDHTSILSRKNSGMVSHHPRPPPSRTNSGNSSGSHNIFSGSQQQQHDSSSRRASKIANPFSAASSLLASSASSKNPFGLSSASHASSKRGCIASTVEGVHSNTTKTEEIHQEQQNLNGTTDNNETETDVVVKTKPNDGEQHHQQQEDIFDFAPDHDDPADPEQEKQKQENEESKNDRRFSNFSTTTATGVVSDDKSRSNSVFSSRRTSTAPTSSASPSSPRSVRRRSTKFLDDDDQQKEDVEKKNQTTTKDTDEDEFEKSLTRLASAAAASKTSTKGNVDDENGSREQSPVSPASSSSYSPSSKRRSTVFSSSSVVSINARRRRGSSVISNRSKSIKEQQKEKQMQEELLQKLVSAVRESQQQQQQNQEDGTTTSMTTPPPSGSPQRELSSPLLVGASSSPLSGPSFQGSRELDLVSSFVGSLSLEHQQNQHQQFNSTSSLHSPSFQSMSFNGSPLHQEASWGQSFSNLNDLPANILQSLQDLNNNHNNTNNSDLFSLSQLGRQQHQRMTQMSEAEKLGLFSPGGLMSSPMKSKNQQQDQQQRNDFLEEKRREEERAAKARSVVKGMMTTKQIKPVLAARGIGSDRMQRYRNSSEKAIGADERLRQNNLIKVSRQHKNSVREVVEDAPQEEMPHTFALDLILEHNV